MSNKRHNNRRIANYTISKPVVIDNNRCLNIKPDINIDLGPDRIHILSVSEPDNKYIYAHIYYDKIISKICYLNNRDNNVLNLSDDQPSGQLDIINYDDDSMSYSPKTCNFLPELKSTDCLPKYGSKDYIPEVKSKDGANGKDGKDGKNGTNGKNGIDGKDGINGKNGIDGKDGLNGKSIIYTGSYNKNNIYKLNDIILHENNKLYICIKDTNNINTISLNNPKYFQLLFDIKSIIEDCLDKDSIKLTCEKSIKTETNNMNKINILEDKIKLLENNIYSKNKTIEEYKSNILSLNNDFANMKKEINLLKEEIIKNSNNEQNDNDIKLDKESEFISHLANAVDDNNFENIKQKNKYFFATTNFAKNIIFEPKKIINNGIICEPIKINYNNVITKCKSMFYSLSYIDKDKHLYVNINEKGLYSIKYNLKILYLENKENIKYLEFLIYLKHKSNNDQIKIPSSRIIIHPNIDCAKNDFVVPFMTDGQIGANIFLICNPVIINQHNNKYPIISFDNNISNFIIEHKDALHNVI